MERPGVGDTAAALFWDQRSKSQCPHPASVEHSAVAG